MFIAPINEQKYPEPLSYHVGQSGLGFNISLNSIWDVFKYNTDFLAVVQKLRSSLNFDASSILYWLPFVESISYDEIKTVLNTYMNLCIDQTIQEFDTVTDKSSLVTSVSQISSISSDKVLKTLTKLQELTLSGDISSNQWLKPKTFINNAPQRNSLPDSNKGFIPKTLDAVDQVLNVLEWTVILGGITFIGYIIYDKFIKKGN